MNYTIKAHETIYQGKKFRSRLEAKWAAMFDLIGWSWTYEPVDLNGWSPDFLVRIGSNLDVFVEVKPFANMPHYIESGSNSAIATGINDTLKKIERCVDSQKEWINVMLVGSTPCIHWYEHKPSVGLLLRSEKYGNQSYYFWCAVGYMPDCEEKFHQAGEMTQWKPR